ncbi:MAG TPA: D-glycero-beta-D-manno-heptose 1,7-bisphosphate 7-phosphatase [Chloroflexota bacterium]|nr:D-glycero-beta-D-manno-heptose 1,7-bisphosphate 7-phosphatase [Chloroflexota bacterium]
MSRVVFIDRDGVINRNLGSHVKRWEEFVFLPGAIEALAALTRHGFQSIVLTNQAAINRGIITRETLEGIHTRMLGRIEAAGARIDGVFYCPHRPDEHCSCRKPQPGLLYQAAERFGVKLSESYLVGDAITDIMAAKTAGCWPILVMTGRGIPAYLSPTARRIEGYSVARNLQHAVHRILLEEGLVEPSFLDRVWRRPLRQPR